MRTFVVTIGIMVAFGWAAAGTPFRGDQALFTQYAQRMNDGAVLYRDLWDVTNPGVYWFYQAAGTCFGFDEDGIHLFEWLWFTAFVFAVQRFSTSRNATPARSASESATSPPSLALRAGIPTFFLGGWYYCTATADPAHLTKAEGLVAFPLFFAIAALSLGLNDRRWCFLAGLAGGIVVLFKFAFTLCLLAGWLPVLIPLLNRRLFTSLLLLAVGFAVPLALAIFYFVRHDALAIAFETMIVTPREMLAVAEPAGATRLMLSVRWFVETSTPLIVLAAAGMLATPKWWRDSFLMGFVLILPAALIVILIQKWSWWTYHFQLLSLPLAVIACVTWPNLLAVMLAKFASSRWMLLLPLLFLPPLLHGASAYLRLLEHGLGLRSHSRSAARLDTGKAYQIARWVCYPIPFQRDDTVFVAGDPLLYQFASQHQSTRTHGWSLELFTPKLWQQLSDELAANPPRWIYIDQGDMKYEALMATKAPELLDWIHQHYRHIHDTKHGTWYEWRRQ